MTEKHDQAAAVREATGAFCRVLLDYILPMIRTVARDHGYAIAVHGSLKRDIDLIAVAWADHATSHEELIQALVGAISPIAGRCNILGKSSGPAFSQKPHGRVAYTLVHGGFIGEIDISVIPPRAEDSNK